MPQASPCPDITDYQRLVAGRFPPAELESLVQHLEDCRQCADRMHTLTGADTLVEVVRSAGKLSQDQPHELVDRVIDQMEKLFAAQAASRPAEDLVLACTTCGKKLKVKAELLGKKVRCAHCKNIVEVLRPAAAAPEPQQHSPASASTSAVVSLPDVAEEDWREILAPPQGPGELGRLGPYRVLELLGAGGMGVVFKAEDPQLQRPVALKAMLPALAARAASRQRFLREARAAAALKHDHIVAIYQVGEDRNIPFLAMEFLEGEPLDQRLKREEIMPIPESVRIGKEIAEGLAAAHARDLVHRDIKPANIWLETRSDKRPRLSHSEQTPGKAAGRHDFRVKILDFGLARSTAEGENLTQQGSIMGTPGYMAPEQAQGESVDHRCDLFSLGCVLYRLVTGAPPFRGVDAVSTLLAMFTDDLVPPEKINPQVPPALSQLIMKLLAKNAADRPESALTVIHALEKLETMPVSRLARGPLKPKLLLDSMASVLSRTSELLPLATKVKKNWRRSWSVAAGCMGVVALTAAIFFFGLPGKGGEGVLALETVDPDIEVIVLDGERQVALLDKKTQQQVSLPDGLYQVELKDDKDGLRLEHPEYAVKAGQRVTIRLVRESEEASKIEPPVGEPLPPEVQAAWKKAGAYVGWMAWAGRSGEQFLPELQFREGTTDPKSGELPAFFFNQLEKPGVVVDLPEPGRGFGLLLGNVTSLKELTKFKNLQMLKLALRTDSLLKVQWNELAELKELESLDLSGARGFQLSGSGLRALTPLKKLKNLCLLQARLTEAGLKELGELKQLESLNLHFATTMTDAGMKQVARLNNLQSLYIAGSQVTDVGLKELVGLKNLRSLDLRVVIKVTDTGLKEVARLKQLRELDLSNTQVTDAGIRELMGLKRLESLGLVQTEITGAGLKNLPRLKKLNLQEAQITRAGLKEIGELKHLQSLDLENTRATDAWLVELAGLKKLQTLNLRRTKVTDAGAQQLWNALPGLEIELRNKGK